MRADCGTQKKVFISKINFLLKVAFFCNSSLTKGPSSLPDGGKREGVESEISKQQSTKHSYQYDIPCAASC